MPKEQNRRTKYTLYKEIRGYDCKKNIPTYLSLISCIMIYQTNVLKQQVQCDICLKYHLSKVATVLDKT